MAKKNKVSFSALIILSIICIAVAFFSNLGLKLVVFAFYPWPKHLDGISSEIISDYSGTIIASERLYTEGSDSLYGGCFFSIDIADCPALISSLRIEGSNYPKMINDIQIALQKNRFWSVEKGDVYEKNYAKCFDKSCTLYYHRLLLEADITIHELPLMLKNPYKIDLKIYSNSKF